MIAWMRSVFSDSPCLTYFVKWTIKYLSLVACGCVLVSLFGCKGHLVGVLNPRGIIAFHERKLFFDTLALMLIVVLPVIIMSFTFVYHYQVSHRAPDYKPNWSHSYFLETIWWGIPCVIIFVLGVITWKKTHELDPYKNIAGQSEAPLIIQAIALPWKWLFIYPEQNIATINYLAMPLNRDVEFWFTTDNVPMSAFFIPQLGSQIYAMAGMRTRLHLLATQTGVYEGLNTQYNGRGFADMHFSTYVITAEEMQQWFNEVKASPQSLDDTAYKKLVDQSVNDKPAFYANVTPDLFNRVVNVYMQTFGNIHPRAN